MEMKKICLVSLFSLMVLSAFSQQQCPQIVFNYDPSGNRIQRKLIIVPCGDENQKTFASDSSSVLTLMIVNVYPNPAQDKINIELPKDSTATESKIELLDINGKILYSVASPSLQIQIDVSQYAVGTYVLKITREKKYAAYNVLKN